jgi:hypothetical protein
VRSFLREQRGFRPPLSLATVGGAFLWTWKAAAFAANRRIRRAALGLICDERCGM